MDKRFSIKEPVRFGWEVTEKHFWFFVRVLLIVFLVGLAQSGLGSLTERSLPIVLAVLIWLITIALIALSIVLEMGLVRISLRLHDKQEGEFFDLVSAYPLFLKYLLGEILYSLIVLGGLVLLVVPGIIWAVKFQFFGYFIIDKGLGPITALKKSSAITQGVKGRLLLFDILLGLINLAGALVFLVGLLVAIPITMMAMAFVYRNLLEQPKEQYTKPGFT